MGYHCFMYTLISTQKTPNKILAGNFSPTWDVFWVKTLGNQSIFFPFSLGLFFWEPAYLHYWFSIDLRVKFCYQNCQIWLNKFFRWRHTVTGNALSAAETVDGRNPASVDMVDIPLFTTGLIHPFRWKPPDSSPQSSGSRCPSWVANAPPTSDPSLHRRVAGDFGWVFLGTADLLKKKHSWR